MKNIKLKIHSFRWADLEVHCEKCGSIMQCGGYQCWFCPNCDD